MPAKRPFRRATVSIDAYHPKSGFGVGEWQRGDGKICAIEVPFTMPGDRVEAQVGRRRSGYYQARLEKLLTASRQREPARCRHFGACGGCRLQHVPYSEQCLVKQQRINALFAGSIDKRTAIEPIVFCRPPWRYRNKMEFSFSSDRAGQRYLGLMLQGARQKVLCLQECHLVQDWFIRALAVTKSWWEAAEIEAYHPAANRGTLRTLTLREARKGKERMAQLTVAGSLSQEQQLRWTFAMADALPGISLFVRIQHSVKGQTTRFQQIHLHGPAFIHEVLTIAPKESLPAHRLSCRISPNAFFQPNQQLADALYSTALQMIELDKEMQVWDLYCGTGVFALACAPYVKFVQGVEINEEAVADAMANAEQNRIENIQFTVADAAELKPARFFADLVLVDPPRAGLGQAALQQLSAIKAPQLLYVSCNPATQAADVQTLRAYGYRVARMRAVDQFPQTAHVENIVLLRLG